MLVWHDAKWKLVVNTYTKLKSTNSYFKTINIVEWQLQITFGVIFA